MADPQLLNTFHLRAEGLVTRRGRVANSTWRSDSSGRWHRGLGVVKGRKGRVDYVITVAEQHYAEHAEGDEVEESESSHGGIRANLVTSRLVVIVDEEDEKDESELCEHSRHAEQETNEELRL